MREQEYVIRQARPNDVGPVLRFVKKNGYESLNLLPDPDALGRDINTSCLNFSRFPQKRSENPFYLFVLEGQESGEIVGTSLIKGVPHRLIYKQCQRESNCLQLCLMREEDVKEEKALELGGLLLDKNLRRKGLARLLSYSRLAFLYLAGLPANDVFTEFGAFSQDGEHCSLWNLSGKSATGISRERAEWRWRDKDFISKLFFQLPARVYPSEELFNVLGLTIASHNIPAVSETAKNARLLLEKLGFRYLFEVEANGSVWYWCQWRELREKINACHIPAKRLVASSSKEHLPEKSAIACTLEPHGFKARYVTIAMSEKYKPLVHIGEKILVDIRKRQEHLFLFP